MDNLTCDRAISDVTVRLIRTIEYLSLPTKTDYIYDVINEEVFPGVDSRGYLEKTI